MPRFPEGKMFDIDPETTCVLATDATPCFMEGGSLAVPGGRAIIPVLNRIKRLVPRQRRFASREAHAPGNSSWASAFLDIKPFTRLTRKMVQGWDPGDDHMVLSPRANFTLAGLRRIFLILDGQMVWPDHGQDGDPASFLHPDLEPESFGFILPKAFDPLVDSPSPFADNLGRQTILASVMRNTGSKTILHGGLVEEICMGWAVKSGLLEGFQNIVVMDSTARLDNTIADEQRRILEDLGAIYLHSDQLRGPRTFN